MSDGDVGADAIRRLPDDAGEMGRSALKQVQEAVRRGQIGVGIDDEAGQVLAEKMKAWIMTCDPVGQSRTLVRLAELQDTIRNTAIREVEMLDKIDRLDEGKPAGDGGVTVIVETVEKREPEDQQ